MKKLLPLLIALLLGATAAQAQSKRQADSLHQAGREQLNAGNIEEGRRLTKQALDMRKALFGEKHPDYITSLNNYAGSFMMGDNPDLDRAIALEQQVMKLCAKLRPPHPDLYRFTFLMGNMYFLKGDYKNAAKYWEQSLALTEKFSEMYEHLLEYLGYAYIELNDVENMTRIMALTEEHNRNELQKPCEEVICMLQRGQYYAVTGDNAKAHEWFLKALAIADGQELLTVQKEYARFFGMTLDDYAAGADYLLAAAETQQKLSNEDIPYATLLQQAGDYSFIGGKYRQAIDCYSRAHDLFSRYDTPEAGRSAMSCLKGMGIAYSALYDYDHAMLCHIREVLYYEAHDTTCNEYPEALLNAAQAMKHAHDYEESIRYHKMAMRIYEERGMHEKYSEAAISLQLCYRYAGDTTHVDLHETDLIAARTPKLDKIISEEKANLQMTLTYYGRLSYAHSLSTIAGCHALKDEYDSAVSYYGRYMATVREAIRDEFRLQSEEERMVSWRREAQTLDDLKDLFADLPDGHESLRNELAAMVYDAALLSKGILLNSAIEFSKVLLMMDNKELTEAYEQSKANLAEIERLRAKATTDQDRAKILQLTQENQALQLRLYTRCAEMADFTDYISYTWQDVRNALNKDDLAVEFVVFDNQIFDSDNHLYAMLLTRDAQFPVAVPVATIEEVKRMETSESLFLANDNPVWGKLGTYLTGKSRIFFSADGGFNHIGIEYLSYNGKPLSEQFQVYRLSSTKELCRKHRSNPVAYAALFGDINYNEQSAVSDRTQQQLASLRGSSDEAGFADLSNTKREVDEIQRIMSGHNVGKIVKLTDNEASREAFLALSDSRVNVIHVATHGVWRDAAGTTERESMENSLLAMAGANIYDGNEGVVTAADIAAMNLRQCGLVVLSACETALGKLGGDGVFGLQRGFKNAGAHTLLMSLKPVYDNSTADLMAAFYRHLNADGSNAREALVAAQQELRDNGFTDAKYWATFILLDADF